MIFAAINWLAISINLLLVVFVIVCLLMSLLILMQRPKQEGLGAAFGGGVTDQVFGARTTNVLQKGTVYLGSLFFLLSLALAILIGKQSKDRSLLEPDRVVAEESTETPAVEVAPEAPKSLADELPVKEVLVEEAPIEEVPVEEAPASTETETVPAIVRETPVEDAAPVEVEATEPVAEEAPVEAPEPAENNENKSE